MLQLHSNKQRIVRKKWGGEKKNRDWTDRNSFVSLGCDYLHGDEGPECSAVFRCESQTIEPVFVLPLEVWEGQKRGEEEEKGRSSVEGITHCENHARSLLLLWWLNCFPVPGYLVKQIVFPYTPRWSLLMAAGDKWLGESHKQVGVVVDSMHPIRDYLLLEDN